MEPLRTIECPAYPTKVLTSKARRPKFWHKNDPKLPQKLKASHCDEFGYILDAFGERVLSNPRAANQPKYEPLSGNNFMSGYQGHVRNKIVTALRDYYRPFVRKSLIEHGPIRTFPLRVEWDAHLPVDKPIYDISNLSFYYKYFEDALREEFSSLGTLIPDDTIRFITHSPGPRLVPVQSFEERKFVFRLYLDDRPELQIPPWKP